MQKPKVVIYKNGPYLVSGGLPLSREIIEVDGEGTPVSWRRGETYQVGQTYDLCRCGRSKSKPHCDGAHIAMDFDGTETAATSSYADQAEELAGPGLILLDAKKLCASARFCHRAGGTWWLTENSNDPASKRIAIEEARDCPSGRLVVREPAAANPMEPDFQPSIGLVQDPSAKCSGPIWLKGGVLLESANGTSYETRNRVTLCRCGKSGNKPFCDGRHITARFRDDE